MSFPAQVMLSGCDPQHLLALREALTAVMARRQASAPGRPPLAAVSNVIQARQTRLNPTLAFAWVLHLIAA